MHHGADFQWLPTTERREGTTRYDKDNIHYNKSEYHNKSFLSAVFLIAKKMSMAHTMNK
jgi:hypothetical protein